MNPHRSHSFLGLLVLLSPLGFFPCSPNRLFVLWLCVFRGLLSVPVPPVLSLWVVCLCWDFLYDIPIGTSFLSVAVICLSVDIARKRLADAPFYFVWGAATTVVIALDALFFSATAWWVLVWQRSWIEWCWLIGAYPLVALGISVIHKGKISAEEQYSLFE